MLSHLLVCIVEARNIIVPFLVLDVTSVRAYAQDRRVFKGIKSEREGRGVFLSIVVEMLPI